MTALAKDTSRIVHRDPHDEKFQVKTATTIYAGSALVTEAADGYARPLAASLTNPVFLGFALEGVVNAGASGAKLVLVSQEGDVEVALAGVTGGTGVIDIGVTVYMADDGTGFTLTSTNNVAIGKVVNYVDGKFLIHYQGAGRRSI